MGRKKKKQMKPFCWYCERTFDDEKVLIQHQKAKHLKCLVCKKKMGTASGLVIHCQQVHKEAITKIPGSIPGRETTEIDIYGMEGVPEEDIARHREAELTGKKKARVETEASDSDKSPPSGPQSSPSQAPPSLALPPQGYPYGYLPGMPPPQPWMMPSAGPPPPPSLPPQQSAVTAAVNAAVGQAGEMHMIYSDENVQMEEKRADHERYRFDEEKVKSEAQSLESSIEARLAALQKTLG